MKTPRYKANSSVTTCPEFRGARNPIAAWLRSRSAGLQAGCRGGLPVRAGLPAWAPPGQPVSRPTKPKPGLAGTPISHPTKPKPGLAGTPAWRPALRHLAAVILTLVLAATVRAAYAQTQVVTGRVELSTSSSSAKDASNVVVWLLPTAKVEGSAQAWQARAPLRLVQKGKRFEPHLLVVPVGAAVEFPNKDPFFHNVFSLFDGKRFDLGLYESGSTRTVHFDRPGISYIFCNIHPEMSAVVIALTTPYYGISTRSGSVNIPDVPPGRYVLNVWYEGSLPEELNSLAHEITISESNRSLGSVRVKDMGLAQLGHKNKYGKNYDDPTPEAPGYVH
jgi:plastocyanin